MIDCVVMNQNRTEATIFYEHKPSINLYHSEGKVETLILWLLTNTKLEIKYTDFLRLNNEETQILNESEVL